MPECTHGVSSRLLCVSSKGVAAHKGDVRLRTRAPGAERIAPGCSWFQRCVM